LPVHRMTKPSSYRKRFLTPLAPATRSNSG
jgi:hypothetical protein